MFETFLSNLFDRSSSPKSTEWRTDKSIFNFILSHLSSDGKLKRSGHDLPDVARDPNKLSFAPGLTDALFGANQSDALHDKVDELSQLIRRIATGDKRSEYAFYEIVTAHETIIQTIDAFLENIANDPLPTEPDLYVFARDLATRSNHRNAVKFGIALLGLCQKKEVVNDLKILGVHDEFTVFAAIALANLSENAVQELWDLGKNVNGWGRIQVVDRLATLDLTDDVRDWLILEGFKNSIMNEYLAYTCAVSGRLHEKLEHESIDRDLFKSSGEIITALINGGPAEDISDYVYAPAVLEDYIRHAKDHVADLSDFLVLHEIKDFLAAPERNTQEGSHVWAEDRVSNCLIEITVILSARDWKASTLEALRSNDNATYWKAKHAANILGIDLWETVWQRLEQNPVDSASWYDVTHYATSGNADKVIDFALHNLPLKELGTGPDDCFGFGSDYERYHSLDHVITFLQNHPRKGETILLAGLKSPVTRNRNMVLNVLATWKQENWSEEVHKALNHLHEIEPNNDTKKNIDRLLKGEDLDWGPHVVS